MKKCCYLVFFLFSILALSAQTNIPAGTLTDLDWTLAESPYIIDGNIDLAVNDQLTIEAGATVEFSGYYMFDVYGRIVANGTATNPITFTAQNTADGWHGLRFRNTATNSLDPAELTYCNFEYGRATGTGDDYRGGAIFCNNADQIVFTGCSFSNCSATTGGAIYAANTDFYLYDSVIDNNVSIGAGGGIYLFGSDAILENVQITNNTSQYDGGGLNCYDSNPQLTSVLIADNFTEWNGGGISAFNNSHPTLTNVTIAYNVANQSGSGIACLYNSTLAIMNSIVWGSATNNIYVETTATITATYSDLQSGTGHSYFGTGCINSNPLFSNPTGGNYTLTWANIPTPDETKSPCIDAGDPNSPLDPDGTVADMGMYYFAQNGITGVITLDGGTGVLTDVTVTATLTTAPGTVYTIHPDASGNYMLSLLAGTYNLVATLSGYSPSGFNNVVVENQLVVRNITLSPPPDGEITGYVQVEGIGNPEDVVVSAGEISTSPIQVTGTNNYQYSIAITPGTYDVTAELPGYETQVHENVVVESGLQTSGINFYLPLTQNLGYISGTISLIGGSGNVQNVIISAGTAAISPNADGTYELEILNGTYDVSAALSGYSTLIQKDVQVNAFATTEDVNFDLVDGWQPVSGTQYVMIGYVTATYDGDFVDNTDCNQLAAFGYDAATGTIEECRGLATWETGNHAFWTNYWSLNGYWYFTIVSDNDTGLDEIWFKFYNSETETIHDCNESIYFQDCTVYPTGVNLTIDSPSYDMEYDLIDNWNWISFNLQPASYDVSVLFDALETTPDIFQIKSQTDFGQYDPTTFTWVGGLDYLSYPEGYKIYMLNAYDNFVFSGEKINPLTHSISLQQGYNWISYIPLTNLDLDEALESIGVIDSTYVKTQTQSAVYYGGWIGDLQVMEPGKSYILYWPGEIAAGEQLLLTYPPNEETTADNLRNIQAANPANWELMPGTESNMILMADVLVNDQNCDRNCSIGLFDENGVCHSIGSQQRNIWYFTVLGHADETLSFRMYDEATDKTYSASEEITYDANSILGDPKNPFTVNFTIENENPSATKIRRLAQNYPNPFNPTTSISYSLPQDGKVLLQIFNVRGQLVTTLVDQNQAAGDHRINWDAAEQSSGIYFYKLHWNGHAETHKCILMK